jgi:hypothetical protein
LLDDFSSYVCAYGGFFDGSHNLAEIQRH